MQESTTNDRSPAGNLDLLPIPDVQLDPPIPNPSEPESGEAVQWSVFIQNVGEIPVRGTLEYSFEGIEYEDRIFLDAAERKFWSPENPLPTALGEHTAEFTARYVPDADSWDYNPDNSRVTVSVEVQAPLRLEWNTPTLELVDANQAPASAPLTPGQMYTMSIGVTSIETGPVNYTCDDGAGMCSKPSRWSSRPVVSAPPSPAPSRPKPGRPPCGWSPMTWTFRRSSRAPMQVRRCKTTASRTSSARSAAFSVGQACSCSSSSACSCSG